MTNTPRTAAATNARREIGLKAADEKIRAAATGEPVIMVMYLDETGICRAWATGPARKETVVTETASDQLAAYLAKNPSRRDDTWTKQVVTLDSVARD